LFSQLHSLLHINSDSRDGGLDQPVLVNDVQVRLLTLLLAHVPVLSIADRLVNYAADTINLLIDALVT